MLCNPHVDNPTSVVARKCRRRFRVPYPLFQCILSECERVNLFGIKSLSRVRDPLEFKILTSLGILGRGNCFKEIGEHAGAFESTCHSVFYNFVNAFGDKLTKVKFSHTMPCPVHLAHCRHHIHASRLLPGGMATISTLAIA